MSSHVRSSKYGLALEDIDENVQPVKKYNAFF